MIFKCSITLSAAALLSVLFIVIPSAYGCETACVAV